MTKGNLTVMGGFGDPRNAKRLLIQEPSKHSGLSLRSNRIAIFLAINDSEIKDSSSRIKAL